MHHSIGDVWRVDWTSKKPWAVQGPGAIARYKTKKEATWVSHLFLHALSQKLERERMINARNDQAQLSTGNADRECETESS